MDRSYDRLVSRLSRRELMKMTSVEVAWEMADDAGFQSIAKKGVARARPEIGHAVHVDVTGLRPGREYWCRFLCGNEVSCTGCTKTAPAAGASIDRLRFAVCGCTNYEMGYFTACRHIAEEDFDFVFFTGDYIYESRADGGRRDTTIRQHLGDEVYTVVDYRNRYAQYKYGWTGTCWRRTRRRRSS